MTSDSNVPGRGVVMRAALGSCLAGLLTSCGSVTLPETQHYRLQVPAPRAPAEIPIGRLFVREVRLAADLASDRLVVAASPVRVQFFRFHAWAAPLDRLLEDAFVAGLTRSAAFVEVHEDLGHATAPTDLVLDALVRQFHLTPTTDGWCGEVLVDVRLSRTSGEVVLHREFFGRQPAAQDEPEAGVAALSSATTRVLEDVLSACAARGMFGAAAAEPPRGR